MTRREFLRRSYIRDTILPAERNGLRKGAAGQEEIFVGLQSGDAAIPERLNMFLVLLFLGIGLFQLFVLPAFLLGRSAWWALLLILCALSTTANWSLIHEAIHRLLAPSSRVNEMCGRALAVFFGAPFEALRFPHLLHHHMNGAIADRPEHYAPSERTRASAARRYYPNLVIGIYTAEVTGTFACLLPRSILRRMVRLLPATHDMRAEAYLLKPDRLARMRLDALAAIVLHGLAFLCYGAWWPLLALTLAARCVLVSVADNGYHYGAPLDAGPRSAYNLDLPFAAAILNFNLHRTHHLHPTLPWTALPKALAADHDGYDHAFFSAMLRQFRGPIPDHLYPRLRVAA
jgi:fatty acid desaturase